MDVSNWNWAVWVMLGLYVWNIVIFAAKHGQRKGFYDVTDALIGTAVGIWLLWCGGFFS